ncbi:hypothetical protein Tco_0002001 [Tanacetum coccineum]
MQTAGCGHMEGKRDDKMMHGKCEWQGMRREMAKWNASWYPIINWESKFYDYGHFGRELIYYRVFRADGSSRWIKTFSEMIKLFDRMDLIEIHSLVIKRFKTTPLEGIDLLLWGDLRTMFESKEDDEL